MRDSLGDRMKKNYEERCRYYLPRRTYSIIRLDGKSFHTYTRGMERPYNEKLVFSFQLACQKLIKNLANVRLVYGQSDEVSLLLTDLDTIKTEMFFDGNIQKIASVSASCMTYWFNYYRREIEEDDRPAFFDSRVFTIPDREEVANYFIWRQQDATRNSISMAAQSLYSHKQLQGVNSQQLQDMLMAKGVNWNNYPSFFKRGWWIIPSENGWSVENPPIFTQSRNELLSHIPTSNQNQEK